MIPKPSPPHPPMRKKIVFHETQILVPKRLGTTHGQRSLAGRSPWGCKESGTTEQLSTAQQAKQGLLFPYLIIDKPAILRGEGTYPRSHSSSKAELELKPEPSET